MSTNEHTPDTLPDDLQPSHGADEYQIPNNDKRNWLDISTFNRLYLHLFIRAFQQLSSYQQRFSNRWHWNMPVWHL